MNRITVVGCILLLLVTIAGGQDEHEKVNSQRFEVSLDLNEANPQIAIWATDSQGEYLGEIYVTGKIAVKGLGNNDGPLDAKNGGSRLSALPIWAWKRNKLDADGNPYPSEANPLPDAVTSATPKARPFVRVWSPETTLEPGTYTIWVELNKSFDKNDHHSYSWYRGQPSLAYKAEIVIGENPSEAEFHLVGHGGVDGSDGSISPDTSTLTSALDLLVSGRVIYMPESGK